MANPELEGVRKWVLARAKEHRAKEEASPTSDRANEHAIRAEECTEIAKSIADYWGPDDAS